MGMLIPGCWRGALRLTRSRSEVSAALRAARCPLLHEPRGLRAPGPCGYFCRAAKVTKNAPEPMVLDSFLGAALWASTSAGEERAVRRLLGWAKPPNWQYSFSRSGTCRSPAAALSKGYCLQGAHVLTGPACKFAPSPDLRAECREATSTIDRTVCRSREWHWPIALEIDRKSEGRSVNNNPRNQGRFLGNAVS